MYATSVLEHGVRIRRRVGQDCWEVRPRGAARQRPSMPAAMSSIVAWLRPWDGVYLGTLDGRLDRARCADRPSRVVHLTADTIAALHDHGRAARSSKAKSSSAMAAPSIGVRGYVSAYDAKTGTLAWRF